jgi:hypothetical protein
MIGPVKLALRSVAAGFALASGVIEAAPPPPPIVPPAYQRQIEGYDLGVLYGIWRFWVEGQKGSVTQALLTDPEQIAGERQIGRFLMKMTWRSDFGIFMAADLRLYCRHVPPHGFDRSSCHYRYRRAYVPHDAAVYSQPDNPVSTWTREAFNPEQLVAHLRAIDMAPETSWWRADWARMFAALPSPAPVLRANAIVRHMDSRDCPALGEAVEVMERESLGWRVDFLFVGQDPRMDPPPPHGTITAYELNLNTPLGGMVTINGTAQEFDNLMRPVFEAIATCERAAATTPTQ